MTLSEHLDRKFRTYTLACRQLSTRFDELCKAAEHEKGASLEPFLDSFDKAVAAYLSGSAVQTDESARHQMAAQLKANGAMFRGINDQVAAIFDEVDLLRGEYTTAEQG